MGSVILSFLLHPVHFLPLQEGGRLTAQALMFPPPCLLLVPAPLDIPLALYVTFTARLGSCSNHSSSSSFPRSSLHAGSVCTSLLPLNFFFSNMIMLLRGCLVFQFLFCILGKEKKKQVSSLVRWGVAFVSAQEFKTKI